MATTNETVISKKQAEQAGLTDSVKDMLKGPSTVEGYATGGYVSAGIPRVPENSDRDLLEQILEVLKEIRDQVVIETTNPVPPDLWGEPRPTPIPSYPGQWYPWQAPYQHYPVWCAVGNEV